MKVFEITAVSIVALLLTSGSAKRVPGAEWHADWKGRTRAVCASNIDKSSIVAGEPSGWTEMT